MKKVGRRAGLIRGASVGIAGAAICAAAIWQASFWLLCFGALVWGTYNAFGQYYRFVAAEVAAPDFRATAVSLVLAGGLVGGIVGPTLSRYTVDLVGPKFAGAYLALIVFALATMAILSRIRIPDPTAAEQVASGRPLSEIARQPKYIVAVMAGAISYGVMNFLMTSTPIAMGVCGHPYGDAAFVISSHVIGMFAPSFVTGGPDQAPGHDPGDARRGGAQHRLDRHRARRAWRWRISGGRWCCWAWAGTSSTSARPRCSPRPTGPKSAPRPRARTRPRSSR